ncbi:sensor histidine kinase [Streptomyces sp. NBC_00102]|uniref:sensor histidine kinase n=1 Tax=Streptomyces sp. NBC_00102 TaxID=2975652 RepID=UPI00225C3392|nr:sensor histidine kinase [Streptomyces sp. NBC_00102]MCX5398717.1 sensor domain-containing protein [Streptomyces sp. NBC_00102]
MQPSLLSHALRQRRYLLGAWPWRASLYLLSGVPIGAAVLVALTLLAVAGSALTVVLVGLPLLLVLALAGIPTAALERYRLRLVHPGPLPAAHRAPVEPGLACWLRTRLQERSTWRELAYACLLALVLWPVEAVVLACVFLIPAGLIAVLPQMVAGGTGEARLLKLWIVESYPAATAMLTAGLLLLPPLGYPLGALAAGRAALTRRLLHPPSSELAERVDELDRSRMRLVHAFEAERRRIERDLHDGAQQRLVALSMTLGLAGLERPAEPVAGLLARARTQADEALVEIRELIRGIHPQVLTDRGLGAAVEDVADRSAVPVDVELDLPDRLPEAVETAAYFAVCEALTNAAKHGAASRVTVNGGFREGELTVEVRDDGTGGADIGAGTGLQGVADRLSVVDGLLLLSSPPGGPTVVSLRVPCPPVRPRS